MIKEKYLTQVREIINSQLDKNSEVKIFIFGSCLTKEHFGDLDIGLTGEISEDFIYKLKNLFEESDLPYFVDVVNFEKVSLAFKNNVFNSKILWLKQ